MPTDTYQIELAGSGTAPGDKLLTVSRSAGTGCTEVHGTYRNEAWWLYGGTNVMQKIEDASDVNAHLLSPCVCVAASYGGSILSSCVPVGVTRWPPAIRVTFPALKPTLRQWLSEQTLSGPDEDQIEAGIALLIDEAIITRDVSLTNYPGSPAALALIATNGTADWIATYRHWSGCLLPPAIGAASSLTLLAESGPLSAVLVGTIESAAMFPWYGDIIPWPFTVVVDGSNEVNATISVPAGVFPNGGYGLSVYHFNTPMIVEPLE